MYREVKYVLDLIAKGNLKPLYNNNINVWPVLCKFLAIFLQSMVFILDGRSEHAAQA